MIVSSRPEFWQTRRRLQGRGAEAPGAIVTFMPTPGKGSAPAEAMRLPPDHFRHSAAGSHEKTLMVRSVPRKFQPRSARNANPAAVANIPYCHAPRLYEPTP